jgi:hypothetical protein
MMLIWDPYIEGHLVKDLPFGEYVGAKPTHRIVENQCVNLA